MSLYADYVQEIGLKKILETDQGFATYRLIGQECYIEDIYVVPLARKSKAASEMADTISAEARKQGCKYLTGSVNTSIKDPASSMQVLLGYGFKFLRSEPSAVWFVKEL